MLLGLLDLQFRLQSCSVWNLKKKNQHQKNLKSPKNRLSLGGGAGGVPPSWFIRITQNGRRPTPFKYGIHRSLLDLLSSIPRRQPKLPCDSHGRRLRPSNMMPDLRAHLT